MRIGIVRTVASPCQCAQSVVKGPEALVHEYVLADSEEIEIRALEPNRVYDLVTDQTDTYGGLGLFRPLVRLLFTVLGGEGERRKKIRVDLPTGPIELRVPGGSPFPWLIRHLF